MLKALSSLTQPLLGATKLLRSMMLPSGRQTTACTSTSSGMYLNASPAIQPDSLISIALVFVVPSVAVLRMAKSVAMLLTGFQRTARYPLSTVLRYLVILPTMTPDSLMSFAPPVVTPLGSVPRMPSSLAAVPVAPHFTGREPLANPLIYLSLKP